MISLTGKGDLAQLHDKQMENLYNFTNLPTDLKNQKIFSCKLHLTLEILQNF